MAMTYGNVYVARVAFGAKDTQTVKAFQEAESYPGTSLIIAYSHCIAHGYDLAFGAEQQKLAIDTGYWPLYRYDPRRRVTGENPLQLDSVAPKAPLENYMRNETRFRMVQQQNPERYKELMKQAQDNVRTRFADLVESAKPQAAAVAVAAPVSPVGNGNGKSPEAAPRPSIVKNTNTTPSTEDTR